MRGRYMNMGTAFIQNKSKCGLATLFVLFVVLWPFVNQWFGQFLEDQI